MGGAGGGRAEVESGVSGTEGEAQGGSGSTQTPTESTTAPAPTASRQGYFIVPFVNVGLSM